MPPEKAAALLLTACLALAAPAAAQEGAPATARVEVAFTPGDDITGLIVERIGRARETLMVQAYVFTDRRIANALLGALGRRVKVELIGDAAQHANGGLPHLMALERAGARIYLDDVSAAAHNKIVIVDGATPSATVITGSFNFTLSAQARNAENVVVLSGNPAVTGAFVENFEKLRRKATAWR